MQEWVGCLINALGTSDEQRGGDLTEQPQEHGWMFRDRPPSCLVATSSPPLLS